MAAKKTPFYEVGLAAGADMRELFGYWLPWEYSTGHVKEHVGTRERASVCDLDYMAEFKIKGRDALPLVQQLFTNDFQDLAVGRVRYTAMCNSDGNMIDDGTVWCLGTNEFIYISGDEEDYEWLNHCAESFNVELTNLTSDWTTLALQGPHSRSVLEKITDADLASVRYYGFTQTIVAGVECTLARMGYTGETGFELHVDPREGAVIWNALFEAGAEHEIVPCGQAALESLRQEAGYLLVGNDHGKSTNPLESGIGRAVKFTKRQFNGRKALSEILRTGINRTIVWLKLDSRVVVANGDLVTLGDQTIGRVTSGSYSPTLDRGVAMAYVAPGHAIDGATVGIDSDGGTERALMSVMPLYDPGDVRTRGTYSR